MKTLVILGAGQMGKAAAQLVNPKHWRILAYGDNNTAIHDADAPVPVLGVREAVALQPDCVLLGVLDEERLAALAQQARDEGFTGRVLALGELYRGIDIRIATTRKLARRVKEQNIIGAIAELGVFQGDFSAVLNDLFPDRKIYLFDTFAGFAEQDVVVEHTKQYSRANKDEFADTSVHSVLQRLPYPEKAIVKQGFFPETAQDLQEIFALVSLDADLYAPTLEGLRYFYPRLSRGGVIILHDYENTRFAGVKKAVQDYEKEYGLLALVPLCDLHGSGIIIKT